VRHRWLLIVAAALVAVVVAGIVLRFAFLRDDARPVAVEEARDRFRASTTTTTAATSPTAPVASTAPTSTAPTATVPTATDSTIVATTPPATTPTDPAASLPRPGVYRYRTTGEETIDALGGATHTYPPETTITVTPDGCGVLLRWDALVERRDEWRLCVGDAGVELQPQGVQHHEFFGQPDTEDLVCDRPVLLVPTDRAASPAPAQQSCLLADDPWLPVWEVLEPGERTVGGVTLDVRHVRMTIEDDDEYWEHNAVDWYLAPDGLPVAVTIDKSSRSPSPIGGVVYRETCRLELVSTDPLT
jgi:hypothetical protein